MRYPSVVAVCLVAWAAFAPLQASRAVPVEGLYDGSVPGDSTEAGRSAAAAEALRQVVVRLTGRSAAIADPALQPVFAEAAKYAQTFRSVAAGQVTVSFDPALVNAALAKAGEHVWGKDRPRTLVVLDGPNALQPPAKRDVQAAAVLRGLPVAFPETDAEPPTEIREGRPEALQALGRSFGAEIVLVLHLTPATVTATWVGPGGSGSAAGAVTEVVSALADRVGGTLAAPVGESGHVAVVVHGVADLRAFATVTDGIRSVPSVHAVVVDSIVGSTLKLRIIGSNDLAGLRASLRESAHFELGEGGGPHEIDLVYRP
jgi:uncharacterized protein